MHDLGALVGLLLLVTALVSAVPVSIHICNDAVRAPSSLDVNVDDVSDLLITYNIVAFYKYQNATGLCPFPASNVIEDDLFIGSTCSAANVTACSVLFKNYTAFHLSVEANSSLAFPLAVLFGVEKKPYELYWLDVLLSLLPIVLLIFFMVVPKITLPATVALPLAALLQYLLRLCYFETESNLVNAAAVAGTLNASTPIAILFGAIMLFRTMTSTGAINTLRLALTRVTMHPIALLMVIGWGIVFVIEGASGFGTPAAIAAPLLVEFGFSKIQAVIITLGMDGLAVIYGAVGTPVWFGFGLLPLSEAQLTTIGFKATVINSVLALIVVFTLLRMFYTTRDLFRNSLYIIGVVVATMVPMLLLALVSYEFPTLIGGVAGLTVATVLAKYGLLLRPLRDVDKKIEAERIKKLRSVPEPEDDDTSDEEEMKAAKGQDKGKEGAMEHRPTAVRGPKSATLSKHAARSPSVSLKGLTARGSSSDSSHDNSNCESDPPLVPERDLRGDEESEAAVIDVKDPLVEKLPNLREASFPLWLTILILLLTRIQQLRIRGLLVSKTPAGQVSLGTFGQFLISAALVVQITEIFETPSKWKHEILYAPSLLPFVVVCTIAFFVFHTKWKKVKKILCDTVRQLRNPIVALIGATAFVELLLVGGERASTNVIGTALGSAGRYWRFLALHLGFLGSFFAGSATGTHSATQYSLATSQSLDATAILALQLSGSALGNIFCIGNIVAVSATLELVNQEGPILKRMVIPTAVVLVLALGLAWII